MQISRIEALRALAKKEARESLEKWMLYRRAPYKPAVHHKMLIAELEKVEQGVTKNLMFNLPPGSAKSSYSSVEFPPWYMGKNPTKLMLACSNTDRLAQVFSRRARNIVDSPAFMDVFGSGLAPDKRGIENWENTMGGEYLSAGVGAAIAGRRADIGLIDDPVKSREDADSERSRESVWEWYVNDFLTRLKPDARQILIMCMTGDTRVLMSDGSETLLRDIRPGNVIATWDKGHLKSSTVKNWTSQGKDVIYEIKTRSGVSLKANSRHPFLVSSTEGISWKRLRNLKVGDCLHRVSDGAIGKARSARLMGVCGTQDAKDYAHPTTTRKDGRQEFVHRHPTSNPAERLVSSTDTALEKTSTRVCLTLREVFALSASANQRTKVQTIGDRSSALTTVTGAIKSEDSYATHATCLLEEDLHQKSLRQQQSTLDFTLDEITSIEFAGFEEVFDIEVDGTENFIANGCASHNTRWHEDDLGGRILERDRKHWKVVSIPMEAQDDDPLGRELGERLWPEYFTDEMIDRAKQDTRSWHALYQQSPTSDDGLYFKAEWFNEYGDPPKNLKVYGASDLAVTEQGGDYTEHAIMGTDASGNVYVLDWWRGQKAADHWIDRMADMVVKWKPTCWFGEAGPIRRSVEPFMMKRLSERGAYCRVEWLPSMADKEARARGIQAMMSMGKVWWPKFAPWKADVMGQFLRFPAGKHDDAVDALGLFGRGLEFVTPMQIKLKPIEYSTAGIV